MNNNRKSCRNCEHKVVGQCRRYPPAPVHVLVEGSLGQMGKLEYVLPPTIDALSFSSQDHKYRGLSNRCGEWAPTDQALKEEAEEMRSKLRAEAKEVYRKKGFFGKLFWWG